MTNLIFKKPLRILRTLRTPDHQPLNRTTIGMILILAVLAVNACGNLERKDDNEKIDEPVSENVQPESPEEKIEEATPNLTPNRKTSPTAKVIQRTRELVILSDQCQTARGHKSFSKEFNQYTCDCYGDRVLNLDKTQQKNGKALDTIYSECRNDSLEFIMDATHRYLSIPEIGIEFKNAAGSLYTSLLPSSDWTLSAVKIAVNRKSEIIPVDSLSINAVRDYVNGPCEWKHRFVEGKVEMYARPKSNVNLETLKAIGSMYCYISYDVTYLPSGEKSEVYSGISLSAE